MKNGILAAMSAYLLWGVFPIYWKALSAIPAMEILGHRVVWSIIVLVILLTVLRRWDWVKLLRRNPGTVATFVGSGIILGINWLIFIWAVNHNFIVEASLGYFINPLVNVLLGVIFLKERMRAMQWAAVALAFLGVAYLTISYGRLPWIALGLALSFGTYGLIRKTARLSSLEGLSIEMASLFLPSLLYLLFLSYNDIAVYTAIDNFTMILLLLSGIITVVPLLLFGYGARKIPLSLVGLLQYIAPSMQFMIGVFLYNEPFSTEKMVGFSIIWIALIIYSFESFWRLSRQRTVPAG